MPRLYRSAGASGLISPLNNWCIVDPPLAVTGTAPLNERLRPVSVTIDSIDS